MKNLEALCCTISTRAGGHRALARQCQYHSSFVDPGMVCHETGIIMVGHCLLCVYPLSTWCPHKWQNLPGLPLHICILQAIKYWRWSFCHWYIQLVPFLRSLVDGQKALSPSLLSCSRLHHCCQWRGRSMSGFMVSNLVVAIKVVDCSWLIHVFQVWIYWRQIFRRVCLQ